ncbi:MAG: VWA domain-containing protein [Planctomycetaceae bacterium]|nr:VWA domain-containing protein [Planctomycetaceae bacterium]
MNTELIQSFLETRRQPLAASVETIARLDVLCQEAPEFAVKALGDTQTHVSQKAHLLAELVRSSVDREQIVQQLRKLSDEELLPVVDGLRLRRLNGRRVRDLGLSVLVGHPRFAELTATHRLRLVRIFKHLLGERTWSSVRRFLGMATPEAERFLQTKVLRFASDEKVAREALCFLAGLGFDQPKSAKTPWLVVPGLKGSSSKSVEFTVEPLQQSVAARKDLTAGRGMPRVTLMGIRSTYHPSLPKRVVRELTGSVTRRVREDGLITTALKAAMTNKGDESLEAIVSRVTKGELPEANVQAAVVLDLSGSTVSSGERLYHPAALGLALVGLLQRYVSDLNVFQVGGSVILNGHGIPRPQGASDLATAILKAARTEPEAILIVTDGFENCRQGDAAQVVAGLRRLGVTTTIEQVTPVIAAAEDLSRRRLSEAVPIIPVEHESGVGELTARLLLAGQSSHLDTEALSTVEQLLFAG